MIQKKRNRQKGKSKGNRNNGKKVDNNVKIKGK